jgi:hypothetical protein
MLPLLPTLTIHTTTAVDQHASDWSVLSPKYVFSPHRGAGEAENGPKIKKAQVFA